MVEFSGRLGPHVVVRERGLTVMLISRTGSSHMFWVQEEALHKFQQQYPQGRICFTVLPGRDTIELELSLLPEPSQRSKLFLGFHLNYLRAATQQQLKLV
jgi:hypothetical protein